MAKHICIYCEFIYDDTKDYDYKGIPLHTRWEDLPENFKCLGCGADKSCFQEYDIPTPPPSEDQWNQ